MQILLSYSQAGPGRKAKQGQEDASRNHAQTLFLGSVFVMVRWKPPYRKKTHLVESPTTHKGACQLARRTSLMSSWATGRRARRRERCYSHSPSTTSFHLRRSREIDFYLLVTFPFFEETFPAKYPLLMFLT